MNLKPNMTYYMQVGEERQLLYYADWPKFEFKVHEEVIKGKKMLKKKEHIWHRVGIETPTRTVMSMGNWIANRNVIDVVIGCICNDRNVQQWLLQNAKIESSSIGLGRTVNINVNVIYLSYSWARRLV